MNGGGGWVQKGVERIIEKDRRQKVEYEVEGIIYASGVKVTTRMDRRLGIKPYASGLSLYDYGRTD